ncbi:hypothetical protein SLOPH_893 [Spraguea lophii 42_110]|uniref:Uncharacterized protein n=1 Tax=Spraguea lophii (strain 42_110) TaxID=1358809 RepID=S7W8B5_SPRLO|nr:hypothetical protein SLOPH_893 [Spraguea lophii 42_110]
MRLIRFLIIGIICVAIILCGIALYMFRSNTKTNEKNNVKTIKNDNKENIDITKKKTYHKQLFLDKELHMDNQKISSNQEFSIQQKSYKGKNKKITNIVKNKKMDKFTGENKKRSVINQNTLSRGI